MELNPNTIFVIANENLKMPTIYLYIHMEAFSTKYNFNIVGQDARIA